MPLSLNFTRLDGPDGSGLPPLVIAHGLLGQGRNFGTLARGFAEKRRVISVDMRNHGDSPWSDEMDYAAMGGDLLALIEAEADGRATLLGHSMGGKAAMHAALSNPEPIAGLIVADIAPVAYDHSYNRELGAMKSLALEGIDRRAQADEILRSRIPERAMRAFLLQNLSLDPDKGARWKPNIEVLSEKIDRLIGWTAPEDGDGYEGPVFFITGGDSNYVRAEHEVDIKYLFPKVEFGSIPGVGHWLHAEKPEAFHSAVEGFLADHDL